MRHRASSIACEIRRPPARSLETDDFDRFAQAFVHWNFRLDQLSGGRFQGRITFADLDGAQVFDCEVNRVMLCRGLRLADSYTFSPIFPSNAEASWRGRGLRPGMMNVVGPGTEMEHRTGSLYRNTSLVVRRDLLERAAAGLIGVDFEACLGSRAVELDRDRADALVGRWRSGLARLAAPEEGPSGFASEGDHALRLAVDLVRTLAAGRVADPVRTTPSQRIRVVRRAEEFARSHPPESVTILTLCELTGVSERSLHLAFLEVVGLSPKAYLKAIRLNQARRAILEAGRARGRIGEIARRQGFLRPDHFAADYRRLFGELPSGLRTDPGSAG